MDFAALVVLRPRPQARVANPQRGAKVRHQQADRRSETNPAVPHGSDGIIDLVNHL
jgi:hypothetical protein